MQNLGKNRSYIDIYAEIIRIAKNGAKKTCIMYGANLSFKQINKYLAQLLVCGLLSVSEENPSKVFESTENGLKFLKAYGNLRACLEK